MIIPTLLRNQELAPPRVTVRLEEPRVSSAQPPQREISYMLSAAAVSRKFAEMLLVDRARALDVGYQGRSFQFCAADRDMILSIRAATVQEFAVALTELFAAPDGG